MVLEVIIQRRKWFFVTVYRPPKVNVCHLRSGIEYICQNCFSESSSVFLLGDVNVDFLQDVNPLGMYWMYMD